jgi:serine/threonine protein kinase
MEDFRVLRKLGQGGQGTTLQVQRKQDGFAFVCKQIVCDSIGAANFALKEAKTLQRLEHAGVCRYEDVFLSEEKHGRESKLVVCIVMEFCERGDLAGAIGSHRDRRAPIPERQLAKWLLEMFQALQYIHSAGVLHRDLKSPNIFLTRHNTVKLGDFGLARQVTGDIRTKVGTPCYLAPEVLQSDSYAEPADAWGAGCIAFEAMTLSFLWDRKGLLAVQVLSEAINAGKLPLHFSTDMRCMVARLLDKDPRCRPSVPECIATLTRCVGAGGQGQPVQPQQQPPQQQPPPPAAAAGGGNAGTGEKPRPRKRDGVNAAVEAAKLAAKQAVQAAGNAFNAQQQAAKGRPVLGEMRRALPPREQLPEPQPPQPKATGERKILRAKEPEDPAARPNRPPAQQLPGSGEALPDAEVASYEDALQA